MIEKGQRYFHPDWDSFVVVDKVLKGITYYHWLDIAQEVNHMSTVSFILWVKREMIPVIDANRIWKELNE